MVFKIPSLLHFLLLQFLCSRNWPKDDCQNIGLCRQAMEVYTKKNRCKIKVLQRFFFVYTSIAWRHNPMFWQSSFGQILLHKLLHKNCSNKKCSNDGILNTKLKASILSFSVCYILTLQPSATQKNDALWEQISRYPSTYAQTMRTKKESRL